MTTLHVFALNTDDPDLRHTNLTRALGEKPDLPPLAEWLGLESLSTREIELFPVKDLGDMSLSDYITSAFGPDPDIPSAIRQRLDALDGSVLLVPDSAFALAPTPGPEATAIAVLPLARPDHRAELPSAALAPMTKPAPSTPEPDPASPYFGKVVWLMMGAVAVALILWLIL